MILRSTGYFSLYIIWIVVPQLSASEAIPGKIRLRGYLGELSHSHIRVHRHQDHLIDKQHCKRSWMTVPCFPVLLPLAPGMYFLAIVLGSYKFSLSTSDQWIPGVITAVRMIYVDRINWIIPFWTLELLDWSLLGKIQVVDVGKFVGSIFQL
ncbi:hypothetical protein Tco_0873683 [Tanacetum coccineum]|uniref:Uncharacterized protein n=1 Tax=Tanacetum coccineum TaxID=301880 RepID=A0ABQ5BMD5_9ASTR